MERKINNRPCLIHKCGSKRITKKNGEAAEAPRCCKENKNELKKRKEKIVHSQQHRVTFESGARNSASLAVLSWLNSIYVITSIGSTICSSSVEWGKVQAGPNERHNTSAARARGKEKERAPAVERERCLE